MEGMVEVCVGNGGGVWRRWWRCLWDRWRCVGDGGCAHVLGDAYICVAYVLCTSPCYVDPSSSFNPLSTSFSLQETCQY